MRTRAPICRHNQQTCPGQSKVWTGRRVRILNQRPTLIGSKVVTCAQKILLQSHSSAEFPQPDAPMPGAPEPRSPEWRRHVHESSSYPGRSTQMNGRAGAAKR